MIVSKLSNAGETIVEVLIAIAVISSAFGVSFATANRANKTMQANTDRYKAQLYANQQADMLHANTTNVAIRTANSFCISSTGAVVSIPVDPDAFPAECKNGDYLKSRIQAAGACVATATYCTYKVHIEWYSAKGGIDQLEVFYAT